MTKSNPSACTSSTVQRTRATLVSATRRGKPAAEVDHTANYAAVIQAGSTTQCLPTTDPRGAHAAYTRVLRVPCGSCARPSSCRVPQHQLPRQRPHPLQPHCWRLEPHQVRHHHCCSPQRLESLCRPWVQRCCSNRTRKWFADVAADGRAVTSRWISDITSPRTEVRSIAHVGALHRKAWRHGADCATRLRKRGVACVWLRSGQVPKYLTAHLARWWCSHVVFCVQRRRSH